MISWVLIETYWNVNFVQVVHFLKRQIVLIETYWNVNTKDSTPLKWRGYVLIETYWNVNEFLIFYPLSCKNVLIETYWNVNGRDTPAPKPLTTRLNRNILECKSNERRNRNRNRVSLNRNILECKFFSTL